MNITETILNEWKVREFPEIFPREFNIHKYIYSKLNKLVVLSDYKDIPEIEAISENRFKLIKKIVDDEYEE